MCTVHKQALVLLLCSIAVLARAQDAPGRTSPHFAFASVAQARTILGARDDFVQATTPVERAARLKIAETVSEDRFMRHMANTARDWTNAGRRSLDPLFAPLSKFLADVKSRRPQRILLIAAFDEKQLPHTRANAIVIPEDFLARGDDRVTFTLAHETFHILTRADSELRDRLYASIGFRRCESVTLPAALTKLRFTNPDAVESRHTIAVRHRGRAVEALPYVRFATGGIDPSQGFSNSLVSGWLLVERAAANCRLHGDWTKHEVALEELEGVYEQVGRNTTYLVHPEEILADNFAQLFTAARRGSVAGVHSPEILERMRRILFGS